MKQAGRALNGNLYETQYSGNIVLHTAAARHDPRAAIVSARHLRRLPVLSRPSAEGSGERHQLHAAGPESPPREVLPRLLRVRLRLGLRDLDPNPDLTLNPILSPTLTPRSSAAPRPGTAAAEEGRAATCRAAFPPRRAAAYVKKHGRCGRPVRTYLPIGRGWPRLEAALSLIWRWRGVLEGESAEAPGRLVSTQAAASPRCLSW